MPRRARTRSRAGRASTASSTTRTRRCGRDAPARGLRLHGRLDAWRVVRTLARRGASTTARRVRQRAFAARRPAPHAAAGVCATAEVAVTRSACDRARRNLDAFDLIVDAASAAGGGSATSRRCYTASVRRGALQSTRRRSRRRRPRRRRPRRASSRRPLRRWRRRGAEAPVSPGPCTRLTRRMLDELTLSLTANGARRARPKSRRRAGGTAAKSRLLASAVGR